MKGKIDNNLNIEGMIKVDFSDVKKQLDKLIKEQKKKNKKNHSKQQSYHKTHRKHNI